MGQSKRAIGGTEICRRTDSGIIVWPGWCARTNSCPVHALHHAPPRTGRVEYKGPSGKFRLRTKGPPPGRGVDDGAGWRAGRRRGIEYGEGGDTMVLTSSDGGRRPADAMVSKEGGGGGGMTVCPDLDGGWEPGGRNDAKRGGGGGDVRIDPCLDGGRTPGGRGGTRGGEWGAEGSTDVVAIFVARLARGRAVRGPRGVAWDPWRRVFFM